MLSHTSRQILILLFSVFYVVATCGQSTRLDSLLSTLPETQDSCEHFPILSEKLKESFDETNRNLSVSLASYLSELEEQCPNLPPNDNFHKIYLLQTRGDTSFISLNHKSLAYNRVHGDSLDIMRNLLLSSIEHYYTGDIQAATEVFISVLPFYKRQKKYRKVLDLLFKIGDCYQAINLNEKAIQASFEGLNLVSKFPLSKIEKLKMRGNFHLEISEGLSYESDYSTGLIHCDSALQALNNFPTSAYYLNALVQKGNLFSKMEVRDSSIFYLQQALSLADSSTYAQKVQYHTICYSIGAEYYETKKFKKAIPFAKTAISLAKRYTNQRILNQSLALYAKILAGTGSPEAKPQLLLLYDEFEKSNDLPFLKSISQALSRIYINEGDTEKAFHYLSVYDWTTDSIYSSEKANALQEAKVKFETDKKEAALVLNQTRLAESKALIQAQTRYLWAVGIGLTLALILGIIAIVAFFQKRKANMLLEIQNQKIEKQNQEKALLLKEIHHRVKNNLQVVSSLLELQSDTLEDPAAIDAALEGQSRVKSIALIHQKLYQTEHLDRIDFKDYVEQLVGSIAETYEQQSVSKNIEIEKISLDIDTAIPVGLILNELISNAYKYALKDTESAHLNVTLNRNADNSFELIVADNGKGLPENFSLSKLNSLGLQLVEGLTRQLKGSFEYYNEEGANFRILFRERIASA